MQTSYVTLPIQYMINNSVKMFEESVYLSCKKQSEYFVKCFLPLYFRLNTHSVRSYCTYLGQKCGTSVHMALLLLQLNMMYLQICFTSSLEMLFIYFWLWQYFLDVWYVFACLSLLILLKWVSSFKSNSRSQIFLSSVKCMGIEWIHIKKYNNNNIIACMAMPPRKWEGLADMTSMNLDCTLCTKLTLFQYKLQKS